DESEISVAGPIDLSAAPEGYDSQIVSDDSLIVMSLVVTASAEGSEYGQPSVLQTLSPDSVDQVQISADAEIVLQLFPVSVDQSEVDEPYIEVELPGGFTDWYRFSLGWWA